MTQQRDSNIELLRIIAILMITFHHTLLDRHFDGIIVNGENLINGWQWVVLLNGFVFIGVNVFILISGYYGIKFKWKGVVNLFICCAFYMFINLMIQRYFLGESDMTGVVILKKSLNAMTRTPKWFIPCYVALYFLSPLLNAAIENMTKKQYLYGLGILSAYCLWFGYVRQAGVFNSHGYAVGQFVWLYFIGGYIKRFTSLDTLAKYRSVNACIWLSASILWGGDTFAIQGGMRPTMASYHIQQSVYTDRFHRFFLHFSDFSLLQPHYQLFGKKCIGGVFTQFADKIFFLRRNVYWRLGNWIIFGVLCNLVNSSIRRSCIDRPVTIGHHGTYQLYMVEN